MENVDFLIIGAGIVGISIAIELKKRHPLQKIIIFEKETTPGKHSSGRNSGVLHSGIYYPENSLKAKVCAQGARELADYCLEQKLPLNKIGKLLIPVNTQDASQLDTLEKRALANGVKTERLDEISLHKKEPEVRSANGEALWVPSTSVGDASAVMRSLVNDAVKLGVDIRCGVQIKKVDISSRKVTLQDQTEIGYQHAINSAGLHADSVAHMFGMGQRYSLLPFKGIYWKLAPSSGIQINHLIYPVPDLRVPFLGVHTTTAIDGTIYLGPTAVPAFGRENYFGLENIAFKDFGRINRLLLQQFIKGRDGFRRLAWQEGRRYFKPWFADAARALLPRLKNEHLLACDKVGIRAQMFDHFEGKLVTDFLVEGDEHSTHILNAISPAWTSSLPFARYVIDQYILKD